MPGTRALEWRTMPVPRRRGADGPRWAACNGGQPMGVDHVAEPVDLAARVEDPARVATVPPGRIPALLSQLSALQGAMAARLISAERDEPMSAEDTLLTVDQAAERLGVSTDWLFRRSRTLPFVVRLGRHLRFSNRGIDRYLRNLNGRQYRI